MIERLRALGNWFDSRLGLRASLGPLMSHPIPKAVAGPKGWWYVFGSASLTLLMIQIVTGIGLALVYVPAADQAYESLLFLNYEQPLGWFLRALHYYAGSGMVVLVLAHMTQVFLHGAYKYPRELTWIVGVFLLLCTLGMFFSGQILRWDPDAYWGLAVAGSMAGRVPVLGPWVVELLLGGPVIGGSGLSRFFTLHVFVIPASAAALPGRSPLAGDQEGDQCAPGPRRAVNPKTYDAEYEQELKSGVPFLGEAMRKDIFFSALAVIVVVVLAALLGPKGPTAPPNPTSGRCEPSARMAVPLALRPAVAQSRRGRDVHHPGVPSDLDPCPVPRSVRVQSRRTRSEPPTGGRPGGHRDLHGLRRLDLPGGDGTVVAANVRLEWGADPGRHRAQSTPRQLQGAVVFQNKDCRNCHALEGSGGKRGPDLTAVGARLTSGQLIEQVSNGTPGGGNMPAYGKQISPDEMTALVDFLASLRPPGQPKAGRGRP